MKISVKDARLLTQSLLQAAGLPSEKAEATAAAIVIADCWGAASHGLLRLPHYLTRLEAGGYPPEARLESVVDSGPLQTYDGNGGLGHWQLWEASNTAAERCGDYGISAAAVGNSGHCGALGAYTLPAIERGLLALVFSNGPAVMPAWGGTAPLLSTSPLAAGIPSRPRPAIVDMATSATARGKLVQYAQSGQPLPEGLAFDSQGRPTVDPREALVGMLAPLGGAKGFALAFMVEALTGGLVGPRLSSDVADMFAADEDTTPQGIAHLIVMCDPYRFNVDPGGDPGSRLDELASRVVESGGRLPGSGRRLPAEIDDDELLHYGEELTEAMKTWCDRLRVPFLPASDR